MSRDDAVVVTDTAVVDLEDLRRLVPLLYPYLRHADACVGTPCACGLEAALRGIVACGVRSAMRATTTAPLIGQILRNQPAIFLVASALSTLRARTVVRAGGATRNSADSRARAPTPSRSSGGWARTSHEARTYGAQAAPEKPIPVSRAGLPRSGSLRSARPVWVENPAGLDGVLPTHWHRGAHSRFAPTRCTSVEEESEGT